MKVTTKDLTITFVINDDFSFESTLKQDLSGIASERLFRNGKTFVRLGIKNVCTLLKEFKVEVDANEMLQIRREFMSECREPNTIEAIENELKILASKMKRLEEKKIALKKAQK